MTKKCLLTLQLSLATEYIYHLLLVNKSASGDVLRDLGPGMHLDLLLDEPKAN